MAFWQHFKLSVIPELSLSSHDGKLRHIGCKTLTICRPFGVPCVSKYCNNNNKGLGTNDWLSSTTVSMFAYCAWGPRFDSRWGHILHPKLLHWFPGEVDCHQHGPQMALSAQWTVKRRVILRWINVLMDKRGQHHTSKCLINMGTNRALKWRALMAQDETAVKHNMLQCIMARAFWEWKKCSDGGTAVTKWLRGPMVSTFAFCAWGPRFKPQSGSFNFFFL